MLGRLIRTALGLVGLEAVRVPGVERRLLFMDRRTRRQVGPDLLLHEHLKRLFERYAVDCVLDVGANTGQYAAELRRAGYPGRLLSFEPVADLCARLRAAAVGDAAWSVHPIALGRATSVAELNVTRHDVFTSFREPLPLAGQRFGEGTAVARRADRRAAARRRPRRAPRRRSAPALLPQDGHAGLRPGGLRGAAGFELTGLFPVSRDEPTGRVIEFDAVLLRAAALPGGGVSPPACHVLMAAT
jgi:FkbM family methyltransferase